MKTRTCLLAGLAACFLAASLAAADEAKPAPAADAKAQPAPAAAPATDAKPAPAGTAAKEPEALPGEKHYKERINVVARKPLRHDIEAVDAMDRTSWAGHDTWQGIRDERPIVARKTLGFHDPDPHKTRQERVLLVSRGPIRGPGFTQ